MQWLYGLVAAVALTLQATVGSAQTVQLDAENLRLLAIQTLDRGDAAAALDMAEALLDADPNDPAALIIRARALRDLGQTNAAISASALAWHKAVTPGQRFAAALARAQALATDGQRLRSQLWLRRAAELAPDDRARASVERDFDYVRSRSALRLRFDLSVRPTSNINNGSSQSTLTIPGLPFVFDIDGAGQALSGYRATFGISGRYRLATSQISETDLTFALTQQASFLSSEAKLQAPALQGSDFDFAAAELGLTHRRPVTAATQLNANLTLGTNWYGGAPLSDYVRLSLGSSTNLSPTVKLDLTFSGEAQDRRDQPVNSAVILGAAGAIKWQLANRDQLQFALMLRDTQSDAASVDHLAATASVTWALGRPVLGAAVSASVDVGIKDYARSAFATDGRQDVKVGLTVDATLQKLDYLGFAPVISLNLGETTSNVNLFDTRDASIGFSITSTF
jgi:hypothetical protein